MVDDIYEGEDTTKDLFLAFEVDGEDYAVDVSSVVEIMPRMIINIVPKTADFIKGIVNLRGDIIPVLSVRKRFMKEEKPFDDLTCIIIIFFEEDKVGLIADRVKGVVTIPSERISVPPKAHLSFSNQFVKNIGKTDDQIYLLLDVEKLLGSGTED